MQLTPLLAVGTWLGAGLLVLAGWAKIRRPEASGRALSLAGRTAPPTFMRLLGAGEVAAGTLAVLVGGRLIIVQALLYLAFTGFVLSQRGAPSSSCGCFGGEEDVPVTWLHVVVDASLALAAIGAVILAVPPIDLATAATWAAAPLVAAAVVAVRLLLVELPVLVTAMTRLEAT